MPSALVIGGRGQCGRAIARRLSVAGWAVTATASGAVPDRDATPGVRWIALDRDTGGDLRGAVAGEFDVVIDNVAFRAEHARQLIGLGDGVGSAVVLSTGAVYVDGQGRSLEAADDAAGFPQWPKLAGYPGDLFDYAAEDAFLSAAPASR
jgi:predicted dinucleotide-binding enzyme